jgi:hypothetical protein
VSENPPLTAGESSFAVYKLTWMTGSLHERDVGRKVRPEGLHVRLKFGRRLRSVVPVMVSQNLVFVFRLLSRLADAYVVPRNWLRLSVHGLIDSSALFLVQLCVQGE